MKDLKPVYKASTEDEALLNLYKLQEKNKLQEKWGKKYPLPINSCPKDSFGG